MDMMLYSTGVLHVHEVFRVHLHVWRRLIWSSSGATKVNDKCVVPILKLDWFGNAMAV